MKNFPAVLFSIIISSMFLICCQRELHFEVLPSDGYLQDSAGNCMPKLVRGTYKQGQNTGDTNFLEVTVNVTRQGAYSINTDTLSGYFFSATGNFADTGRQVIKLLAKGTPQYPGVNHFYVRYSKSSCYVNVKVIADVPPDIPLAVYTLAGAPDSCTSFTVAGSYIKNADLNDEDSVTVQLNVSVGGKYSITTDVVNGYVFSASGLIDSGMHKVTLKGTGTPMQAGTDVFTVTGGNSTCHFSINVKNHVVVDGSDYFPLTTNSYWTYDDLFYKGDTITRVVKDSIRIDTLFYHPMHEYDKYGADNVANYTRLGNSYLQYGRVDTLSVALRYLPTLMGTIEFLKEGLSKGAGWKSEEYHGSMSSGQTVYLQYYFYCVENKTGMTIKNNSFINVYHILMLPQIRSEFGPYNSTNERIDLYYAKGIGLIYLKVLDNSGYLKKEMQLRYWKVY